MGFESSLLFKRIMAEIADKSAEQRDVAQTYALIMIEDVAVNWSTINHAIIKRWSLSGLENIKELAAKQVLGPFVERTDCDANRPRPEISWIVSDDTGISSKTIWAVMMGVRMTWADIPYDVVDFGRCYRLLKAVPKWRGRLNEVAEAYPRWEPIIEAWDELETMYEATLAADGSNLTECMRMYERMNELRIEGRSKP